MRRARNLGGACVTRHKCATLSFSFRRQLKRRLLVLRVGIRLESLEPIIRGLLDLAKEPQAWIHAVTVLEKPTEDGQHRIVVTSSLHDALGITATDHATATLGLLYRPAVKLRTDFAAGPAELDSVEDTE